MPHEARHLGVTIDRSAAEVYAFAADPANLPEWSPGLADGEITIDGEVLTMDSPLGCVTVVFATANELGVLDHVVTLPSGEAVLNPVRVSPNADGADVMFTVHRRAEMSADDFDTDCATVQRDLDTLRTLLES